METIAADLARAKERLKHTEEIKKKRLLLKQQAIEKLATRQAEEKAQQLHQQQLHQQQLQQKNRNKQKKTTFNFAINNNNYTNTNAIESSRLQLNYAPQLEDEQLMESYLQNDGIRCNFHLPQENGTPKVINTHMRCPINSKILIFEFDHIHDYHVLTIDIETEIIDVKRHINTENSYANNNSGVNSIVNSVTNRTNSTNTNSDLELSIVLRNKPKIIISFIDIKTVTIVKYLLPIIFQRRIANSHSHNHSHGYSHSHNYSNRTSLKEKVSQIPKLIGVYWVDILDKSVKKTERLRLLIVKSNYTVDFYIPSTYYTTITNDKESLLVPKLNLNDISLTRSRGNTIQTNTTRNSKDENSNYITNRSSYDESDVIIDANVVQKWQLRTQTVDSDDEIDYEAENLKAKAKKPLPIPPVRKGKSIKVVYKNGFMSESIDEDEEKEFETLTAYAPLKNRTLTVSSPNSPKDSLSSDRSDVDNTGISPRAPTSFLSSQDTPRTVGYNSYESTPRTLSDSKQHSNKIETIYEHDESMKPVKNNTLINNNNDSYVCRITEHVPVHHSHGEVDVPTFLARIKSNDSDDEVEDVQYTMLHNPDEVEVIKTKKKNINKKNELINEQMKELQQRKVNLCASLQLFQNGVLWDNEFLCKKGFELQETIDKDSIVESIHNGNDDDNKIIIKLLVEDEEMKRELSIGNRDDRISLLKILNSWKHKH